MSMDLFEYNRQAFESACEMLAVTGKACVVHPTGTGAASRCSRSSLSFSESILSSVRGYDYDK